MRRSAFVLASRRRLRLSISVYASTVVAAKPNAGAILHRVFIFAKEKERGEVGEEDVADEACDVDQVCDEVDEVGSE